MTTAPGKNKKTGGKTEIVIRMIRQQIDLGNFSRNSLLPSERDLAKELKISYMTIRRAIGQMVDDGILVRVQGKGTFVRGDVPANKMPQTLGIVLPAWESQEHSDLMMTLSKKAEENGLLPKIIFCRSWQDRVIPDAYENCDFLIIFPLNPFSTMPPKVLKLLKSGKTKIVILGGDFTSYGFDSVSCDSVVRTAIDRLRELGHERIGLVYQYDDRNGEKVIGDHIYSLWKKIMQEKFSAKEVDKMGIALPVRQFDLPHTKFYEILRKKGKKLPFTALFLHLAYAWGGLAALIDSGIKIPEELSILCFGDRQEAPFYRPKLSIVSVSFEKHAELAIKALRQRTANPELPPQLLTVTPEMIPGETLKKREASYIPEAIRKTES